MPPLTSQLNKLKNAGNAASVPAEQPFAKLVVTWLAERADTTPDAIAVVSEKETLTYRELDQRANQLAHHLQSLGVGPEVITAMCVDRSVAAVIAALAVLKAGGAYLPLDPGYPADRLAFILKDAQPAAVITQSQYVAKVGSGSWQVVNVDDISAETWNGSYGRPNVDITPASLAYVIYTSGSTGQPKGVQVTNSGLSNLVGWHMNAFGVTAADRATQLSSLGFDAAVWETWAHLCAGASLYIVPEIVRLSPELLRDWMATQQISISFVPTAVAERLIAMDWSKGTALRFLLTGADTLHHYPGPLPFTLVNNYGPTEATVVATSGPIGRQRPDRRPPIGRPITNTTIHILDDHLQPVPAGEVGQIYIAGAGVARGYLNRPELTAEKFIADPFTSVPGARLYQTGDLARWLPDGQIAYVGRTDEQIKVRGFRIEPNEIVSLLNSHPAVQANAVIAEDDGSGAKRLLAYIVPNGASSPRASELRTLLLSQLPDYMLPSTFIRVDELPTTANGKLDRNALPAPSASNTLQEDEFVAPRTPLEERVTAIIASLLGLDKVGVNENFFLIGGHSLLGTQLIARVRDTFGVDLSLRSIFDLPTPAQLAQEIERLTVAQLDAMSAEQIQQLLHQARAANPQ
jgi:amino acid adenylation domain-containing protein